MTQLPAQFYWFVGMLVVTNAGLIISGLVGVIKFVWWASQKESEIRDAKETSVRAHKRIDKIEGDKSTG